MIVVSVVVTERFVCLGVSEGVGVAIGTWVLFDCVVELLVLFCPGRLPLCFFGWTRPACLLLDRKTLMTLKRKAKFATEISQEF